MPQASGVQEITYVRIAKKILILTLLLTDQQPSLKLDCHEPLFLNRKNYFLYY